MAIADYTNDIVLVISLGYLCVDINFEWEEFSGCKQPVHVWLLVSYILIVASRLIYVLGAVVNSTTGSDGGTEQAPEFLLQLRQKNHLLRFLIFAMWSVIAPFFTFWTALGSYWLLDVRRHTPMCLPNGTRLWFLAVWQVLSYLWITIHGGLALMAWVIEKRVRSHEADLRQLEEEDGDGDVRSRWGSVSRLVGYTSLQGMSGTGLSPAAIKSLPCLAWDQLSLSAKGGSAAAGDCEDCGEDCPICLNVLKTGEKVRQLDHCGHTFHRSCIDLWLLRRADCPLCKRSVRESTARGKL